MWCAVVGHSLRTSQAYQIRITEVREKERARTEKVGWLGASFPHMMEHTDTAKPSGLQTLQPKVHFISYSRPLICASVTLLDHNSGMMRKYIWSGLRRRILVR